MDFQPSFLTSEQINDVAEEFLNKYHPIKSIPIPIEEIIDLNLQIDIIPVPGLKDSFIEVGLDIDAFITRDFKSIYADKLLYNPRKTNVRYRFSLAHEIGHRMLHEYLFECLDFNNSDEWANVLNNIPQNQLRIVEFQADEFAGLVLVPRKVLRKEFKEAIKKTEELLDLRYKDRTDFVLSTAIECFIAPQFQVSKYVAKIRIERDNLI